ncbi:conserved hypothetical protein [Nitrosococcus halophilus Nc 4]|uniref:Addiction module toxin, RelE/StbE family n=1 Tax=Nitrosococcus halophilus (strain Nc4) TaxID=472759 RepID=D5C064_NITHN|nr:type II toxin-antitoxin system RelE/ParE family toxin [Nitrosococcus halophilus]ADE16311.1 conserved hypothetical protein [Nitrosococcus halophilus Nc 4]
MHLLVTPSFAQAAKKLHRAQKAELDKAVRSVSTNPEVGEVKVGDLAGIRVYKFHLSNQLCLLAYRILEKDKLKLLTFGPHENFYHDLKRRND